MSAIIVVHFKKLSVKDSVRKSFCCVKTVLGKVSACNKIGVYFFLHSLYVQFPLCRFFSVPKNLCVKIVLCKGFSVAKGSVCKSAYAPFFYVRKNIFVQSIGM